MHVYIGVVHTSQWSASDLPDLHGHHVIVTGANSGIGRSAATEFARAGAAVTLAVRDLTKGQTAANEMFGDVTVRSLDLTDLGSVHAFAEGTVGPINILVNNAGIMATPMQRTTNGFEMQIGTNHLGHFALTNLLLPKITGRVVVVSSELHRQGRIDLDDLNWQRRNYQPLAAYSQSKLANLLFVVELRRRLDAIKSPVAAIAAHPGYAATNLQGRTASPFFNFLGNVGNQLIAQSAAMGALPTLYAAAAELPSGSYVGPNGFRHMRGHPVITTPSSRAHDASVARQLWSLSEELTCVNWPFEPSD